jgi:hypothetical protein
MSKVTGKQVRDAMIAANITSVDHHECGGCYSRVFYSREGEQLFFNPRCGCTSGWTPPEPRPWSDAADWINMQTNEGMRQKLRAAFGLAAAGKGEAS